MNLSYNAANATSNELTLKEGTASERTRHWFEEPRTGDINFQKFQNELRGRPVGSH